MYDYDVYSIFIWNQKQIPVPGTCIQLLENSINKKRCWSDEYPAKPAHKAMIMLHTVCSPNFIY